jgi:hypothetical protein
MAHAEKCPVCNGKGEIFRAGDAGTNIGDTRSNNVCHGCNGKGWVEVGTEYPNPIHSGQSYSPEKSKIGTRDIFNWGIPNKVGAFSYPYPADIEIHSKKPLYEGHSITVNSCDYCDGSPCYCDISGLKANDAMYALVNGGDTALWQFLEDYYKAVFKGKEYPEPAEYKKPLRKSKS